MSDEDEVRAIEEHWPTALRERDGQWLSDHLSESFVVTQPDGSVLDRDRYLTHRVLENDRVLDGVSAAEHIEMLGDVAVVVSRTHLRQETRSGERYERLIRGTAVYVRSDRWRATAMHLSEHSADRSSWGADLLGQ